MNPNPTTPESCDEYAKHVVEYAISFLVGAKDKVFLGFLREYAAVLSRELQQLEKYSINPIPQIAIIEHKERQRLNRFFKKYPKYKKSQKHMTYYSTFHRAIFYHTFTREGNEHTPELKKFVAEKMKEILIDAGHIDVTGKISEESRWQITHLNRVIERNTKQSEVTSPQLVQEPLPYFHKDISDKQLHRIADYLYSKRIISDAKPFVLFLSGTNTMMKVPSGKIFFFIEAMKILYKERKVIRLSRNNNACLSHITSHISDFTQSLKKSKPSQYLCNLKKKNAPNADQIRDLREAINTILR